MIQLGSSAGFAVQDISVDRDGRVSITNPWMASRLHAAVAIKTPAREATNTNCNGCNTVKGCGETTNSTCPVNTVNRCGGLQIGEEHSES
jgi:hypothetical protein